MDNVQSFTSFRQLDNPNIQVQEKDNSDVERARAMLLAQAKENLARIEATRAPTNEVSSQVVQGQPQGSFTENELQGKMLSKVGEVSQRYGNKSSFYKSGSHFGTDIAVPTGTKVALPQGQWKVIESFTRATTSGPNNAQSEANRGYGNSVLPQNVQTGEKIRLSHLSQVDDKVQLGSVLNSGLS